MTNMIQSTRYLEPPQVFHDAEEKNRETMGDLGAAVLAPGGSTVVASANA